MCSDENNSDGYNNHHDEKEAQDQGPDVEALGGRHIAPGHKHDPSHFRVPKLQGAGECHEAQVAGIHEDSAMNRDQTAWSATAGHVTLITVVTLDPKVWSISSWAAPCSSCSISCWGLWSRVPRQSSCRSGPGRQLCQKRRFCVVKSALEIGDRKNALLNLLAGQAALNVMGNQGPLR